ncbi:MAG: hypothetical protein AB200_01020 [Parcubacteria bacterium C7867-005]|nr:MAG: hypothetical protein AB200_01020 [Parcubacteria bacterium C7867-005]
MNNKTTIRDFFLQLGAMISLYAGAIALLNLLFRVINVAFPQVTEYYGYYYSSSISFPVATLIIIFPLFLILSSLLQKSYAVDPTLREGSVRRWLLYITLFVAGAVLVADLITLLYLFIDGQEMTAGFLLKVLSVFVVAGSVFGYFLADLRSTLTTKNRMAWRIFSIILVVGSILVGFSVIGSPSTQRMQRQDSERINNLQNIQSQVTSYWQQKGILPAKTEDLNANNIGGWVVPKDPKTEKSYEYTKVDGQSFKLCATFEKPTPKMMKNGSMVDSSAMYGLKNGSNWQHEAGYQCFIRTIDPDFYPVQKR